MAEVSKKNLLIFFGELRTFEYVVPLLEKLDEVDVVISTWSESKRNDSVFHIDEDYIRNILPTIKQIHITNSDEVDFGDINNDFIRPHKMMFHWKLGINNIVNPNEYENVILHRCDLVSNWHTILDLDIEEDTIHFHHSNHAYYSSEEHPDAFWVNDYYFFGKFDIVKKFINSFNGIYPDSHVGMYKTIYENNINYKQHILKAYLLRDGLINHPEKLVPATALLLGPPKRN